MTGKTKQRMVMNGPASVLLTVTKEDIGVTETKNIVFHPHGVQVWIIFGYFGGIFPFVGGFLQFIPLSFKPRNDQI